MARWCRLSSCPCAPCLGRPSHHHLSPAALDLCRNVVLYWRHSRSFLPYFTAMPVTWAFKGGQARPWSLGLADLWRDGLTSCWCFGLLCFASLFVHHLHCVDTTCSPLPHRQPPRLECLSCWHCWHVMSCHVMDVAFTCNADRNWGGGSWSRRRN